MIAALLALLGFVLIVLPGVSGPPLRLPASEWARVAAAALLLGFVAFEIGLVLLAMPTMLRALHAVGLAEVCESVAGPVTPGGDVIGWFAFVLAALVAVRASSAWRRARRSTCVAEAEPWLGRHEDRGDFELVVLPTPELVAVSVPAAQPQVLISDGLVERLETEQLEAVIRHEAMHHRFRHWQFSLLATSIERSLRPLPGVVRSTRALRNALEEWADEGAAGDTVAGRAVVRDAIVAVAGPVDGAPESAVGNRARRLDRGPSGRTFALRILVHAPVLLLGMTLVALSAGWAAGAHHVTALVGYC
jgi:Zn-dependent protease with chaperone function